MKKIYLSLIFLGSLCACKQKSNDGNLSPDIVNNPISASSEKTSDEQPEITFSEKAYDFGKIIQGEKVNYSFKFKNTGKADLIITNASASCGCTIPEYPKEPIAPGKEGVIKVVYNSEGKSGIQNKTVTIITNTIPNTNELLLSGEVIVKK